jgi:hypothetical protein
MCSIVGNLAALLGRGRTESSDSEVKFEGCDKSESDRQASVSQ